MTTGDRLKQIRKELGLSQEAIGKLGLVTAPGWIKLENGQRQPSEKLITKLYDLVKQEPYSFSEGKAHKMKLELLLLKYASNPLKFTSVMAGVYVEHFKLDVLRRDADAPEAEAQPAAPVKKKRDHKAERARRKAAKLAGPMRAKKPARKSGLQRAAAAAKATRKSRSKKAAAETVTA